MKESSIVNDESRSVVRAPSVTQRPRRAARDRGRLLDAKFRRCV